MTTEPDWVITSLQSVYTVGWYTVPKMEDGQVHLRKSAGSTMEDGQVHLRKPSGSTMEDGQVHLRKSAGSTMEGGQVHLRKSAGSKNGSWTSLLKNPAGYGLNALIY